MQRQIILIFFAAIAQIAIGIASAQSVGKWDAQFSDVVLERPNGGATRTHIYFFLDTRTGLVEFCQGTEVGHCISGNPVVNGDSVGRFKFIQVRTQFDADVNRKLVAVRVLDTTNKRIYVCQVAGADNNGNMVHPGCRSASPGPANPK